MQKIGLQRDQLGNKATRTEETVEVAPQLPSNALRFLAKESQSACNIKRNSTWLFKYVMDAIQTNSSVRVSY